MKTRSYCRETGKVKHPRRIDALRVWFNEGCDLRMNVYLCSDCGRFHLGHLPEGETLSDERVRDYMSYGTFV